YNIRAGQECRAARDTAAFRGPVRPLLCPSVNVRASGAVERRGATRKMDGFLQYWRALVRSDESLPLFEAALAIAQDEYPRLSMPDVLARVDGFALAL